MDTNNNNMPLKRPITETGKEAVAAWKKARKKGKGAEAAWESVIKTLFIYFYLVLLFYFLINK